MVRQGFQLTSSTDNNDAIPIERKAMGIAAGLGALDFSNLEMGAWYAEGGAWLVAALTNAGIQVEVWISASDRYMHQMKIDMSTTQFTWSVTYHFSSFVAGGDTTSA